MKQNKQFILLVLAFSLMSPCVAHEQVQAAAKAALENVTGGKLGKLYKVRSQAETPDRREMIVKACLAGLYAIGDSKNAVKIQDELNEKDFFFSFSDECGVCNGKGKSKRACYKCKGAGKCQNRKCNDGIVTSPGFDGRTKRKCSACGGIGKCANCKGEGAVLSVCRNCNGSKRVVNHERALAVCQEQLKMLAPENKRESDKGKRGCKVVNVKRNHSFNLVTAKSTYLVCDVGFQVRALLTGGCNYIVYQGLYDVLPDWSSRLRSIRTIVFNGDGRIVSNAFKAAFEKAREWIEIGHQYGKTISEFRDMKIDVPDGCAIEIPAAVDSWAVFHKLADMPRLKRMKSAFSFCFSDKKRVLRFLCGDVVLDFEWSSSKDENVLTELSSACDANALWELYTGKPGESELFKIDETNRELPKSVAKNAPKWEAVGEKAALSFGYGQVSFAKCSDGTWNYSILSDSIRKGCFNDVLIFSENSQVLAYQALENAFKIALEWRDVARKHRVQNLVKEIEIQAPKSTGIQILGTTDAAEKFWMSISDKKVCDDVKQTKFWFSVQSNGQETDYYLYFGNEDASRGVPLNNRMISEFRCLNPELAMMAVRSIRASKAEEESIFK